MAKRFRLQRLLGYRERLEQEQQAALAHAARAQRDTQQALDALRARDQAEALWQRSLLGGALDPDTLERTHAYRTRLAEQERAQHAVLEERRRAVQAAERLLMERRRDRRSLEKLQERHQARQAALEQHAEAVALDEMTMNAAARRPRE